MEADKLCTQPYAHLVAAMMKPFLVVSCQYWKGDKKYVLVTNNNLIQESLTWNMLGTSLL